LIKRNDKTHTNHLNVDFIKICLSLKTVCIIRNQYKYNIYFITSKGELWLQHNGLHTYCFPD